jgi:AraC family transcriptional regulator
MKEVLASRPTFALLRRRYGPREHHPRHKDPHSRVSLILRGGLVEEGRGAAIRLAAGDVLLKTRNAPHEDAFGDGGAVLLALEFHDDDPFEAIGEADFWGCRSDGLAFRHAATFLEAALAGDGDAAFTTATDLVATCADVRLGSATPPRWLADLKCELEDASLANVCVAARARRAGAHPAHASRLFRRCYGTSITEHAQAHSVRRAIGALVQPDIALGEVALLAGFYDQSHMTRIFRRMVGRTPGAHRALLAAAC